MLFTGQILAIIFLGPKWTPNVFPKLHKMESTSYPIFGHVFLIFGLRFGCILGAILELKRPWCAKMGPRRTSRASKYWNAAIAKNAILRLENNTLLVLGALKTSIRSSEWLWRCTWSASRLEKQGSTINCFFVFVWSVLERFWDLKTDPKINITSIKQVIEI